MDIEFECPSCGQHMSASSDDIGADGSCPACGKSVTIPNVGLPIPPPIAPFPQNPPKRGFAKKILLVACIVCGGIIAVLFLSYLASPKKFVAGFKEAYKPISAKAPVVAAPIEINVATNADERLFLMNLLEHLYSELPKDVSNPQAVQTALGNLRYEANRHYEDIKQKNLDDRLASLYSDFLSAVDDYNALLVNYGKIESDAVARTEKESAESGFSAGFNGAETYADARDNGNSGSDALLQGAAVGIIQYLWDDYNKGKERDAAKQQELQEANQEFQNKFSTYIARSQNAAVDLSQKYSWEKGEAGFDDSQMNRPRDPFQMSQQAYDYSSANQITVTDMIPNANQCLNAACLVPSGDIYDEYRANFLWAAGDIASRAFSKEIGNQSWGAAYNQTAASAVQVWKACLKYTPDPTGECREQMVWALMASGDLKEALNQANPIATLRQNSASFSYNMACLESDLGDTDTAFKWFDYTVRTLGYNNIVQAKIDPDLEAMRTEQQSRFDDLTSVKWTCGIGFGIFNDDVIVTNYSVFSLTHVVFNGTVTSHGSPQQISELKADQIAPGGSYKWVNAISVPNGSTIAGTLSSDQNR